ncbi:fatty acyl-CoA synthetase [Streptantibioticus cattleyicolor]|uniref:Acyl-CoA synthetase n=1 Tax=Streptantibioticus cattleyicolor (strain ATCC 35852 / DSM 46488 / JCM 4925 / NBRC 14057 / NRRL 8057) TaxID=1003195 RepID=F8JMJ3_STREN|nr:fatty acyl-CoA synthetase [Streptantibioticus cattleyicolor]AEW99325.1 acyl-CoA synthetase [Streptantibioticus cattleyicolor NRRL 8057 = DSM 46488]CCB71635.1 Acyl-CoA synthetase (AMP-forming)/AMP-acid ligase II [Streptantibioticus cattleyicolor NRRL 8057 = DSM 46488]
MGDEPDAGAAVGATRGQTIADLLRRTAARLPAKTALVWGERRETFAELDAAVGRTAGALAARGVAKGDRVALFSRNCREFVVVYFALARLGAISVPVNFMLGAEELAYVLDHSGATGLVAQDALLAPATAALAALAPGRVRLRGRIGGPAGAAPDGWEDVAAWEAHQHTGVPGVLLGEDEPVQLMYTSGTESRPKGAVLSSRSLIANYVSAIEGGAMTGDDIEVHALPLYHCAQLHGFLTPDVYLGATSVVLPGPDPVAILRAVERERATKLFCPPTVWVALLRSPEFDRHDLSSLRKGYYGASAMPREVLAELRRRLPEMGLTNFYGQTEMSPVATVLRPGEHAARPGSAGRPVLNVETRVVDDAGRPVAPGVTGEIVHRSPQAMLGYWNDPRRTAEAFRGGWFHSGDLGFLDDEGFLYVVDRKKDMIKTGGENVSGREVEEVLHRHPGVAEAAVFGIAHPYWVEAVTAAVVPRDGVRPTPEELIAHCRAHLAGFKVPKYVVVTGTLPKNPSGKILKRRLREEYASLAGSG